MARLAQATGWARETLLALPVAEAEGLLAAVEQQRRGELADLALAIYAGTAAALNGPAGWRALTRWAERQRGQDTAPDHPLAAAGIVVE